jgi:hypothetical protein
MNVLEMTGEDGLDSMLLPFSFTKPIELKNIEPILGKPLRDLVCEITEVDGKSFVKIHVAMNSIERGSIGGEVRVRDKLSGTETATYFSAKVKQEITISPKVIRFVLDSDTPQFYNANVIIRVNAKHEYPQTEIIHEPRLICKVKDNLRISSTVKPLARDIFRVSLTLEILEGFDEKHGVSLPVDVTLTVDGSNWTGSTTGILLAN